MLWFFNSFKVGVCSLLEDHSKKLSTPKVIIFSCQKKKRSPFSILAIFLIFFLMFRSFPGGIMEEHYLIELRATRGTGKLISLKHHRLVYMVLSLWLPLCFRILVWEDGFCDFCSCERSGNEFGADIFFKLTHEVYNFGEG